MSDARRARAERRAAIASRTAQMAPVGGHPRRSLSPAVNAADGPAGNEQQASSQHPSVRQEGRTATPSLTPVGSSSRAFRSPLEARAALIAANELLRYRPVDDVYEEWLDRVAELVRAAGGSPAPSVPLHRTPPRAGNEAPGAYQPPPLQEDAMAPRRVAPGRNPLRQAPAQQERSCQEVPRLQEAARALPAPARRDPAPAPARQDPRCSKLQCMETRKTKLSLTQSLPWQPQAVVPTPPSCAASRGPASSSQTCLLATTARPTLRSSSSSTRWASKVPTEMRRSWRTGFPWRSRTEPAPGS